MSSSETTFFLTVVLLTVGLGAALWGLTWNWISFLERKTHLEGLAMEHTQEGLLQKKENAIRERVALEREAHKILALYEMTKEITRKHNPEEAFSIFKSKLRENVVFEDCRWEEILPQDLAAKDQYGEFVWAITDGKDTPAYLVFKGVNLKDKDKVDILFYQFLLALRRIWLYQKIENIAIVDPLTEVYTRRYFMERLSQEFKRSTFKKIPLSFLMIDVDHFKEFNDRYGHLTGDQILREIGRMIKAGIREIDIAGRFGGEEFCVVLPETDQKGALFAAERLRLSVEKSSIKAYETTVQTTLSIGLASFPDHASTTTELIDKADWALYRAKKTGRNRVCSFGVYGDS